MGCLGVKICVLDLCFGLKNHFYGVFINCIYFLE